MESVGETSFSSWETNGFQDLGALNSHDTLMSSSYREPQERRDDTDRECHTPQQDFDRSAGALSAEIAFSNHDADTGGCSETQGGVCASSGLLEQGAGGGAPAAYGGPAKGVVCGSEAKEVHVSVASQLEEAGLGESQGAVLLASGDRSRSADGRPLESLDQYMPDTASPFPVCEECGIPMITRTNRLSKEEFWGCRRFPSCRVTLPMTYGDQPVQEAIAVLKKIDKQFRMPFPPTPICVKDQKDVRTPKPEGILPGRRKNKAGYPTAKDGLATSSDGSWVRAGPTPVEEIFIGGRGGRGSQVHYEPHRGRARGDHEDEKGEGRSVQGGSTGEQVSSTAVNAPESTAETVGTKETLDPGTIRRRIKEGNARRAYMKQGTVKRRLGNTRAVAAGIFISTVAMAGAALQAVPFGNQKRPDVLEKFEDSAQMSSNFSRWGLSVHDPIDVRGDLSDEDGRDRLMQWPFRPPVYAMHRNMSQAQRRERRWRERQIEL